MLAFENALKLDDCILYGAGHGCDVMPSDADDKYFRVFAVKNSDAVANMCGREYTLCAGSVVLAFPYESIEVKTLQNEKIECSYLCFSIDSVKYGDAFGRIKHGFGDDISHVFTDEHVTCAIENICAELEAGEDAFSHELVSLLCSQMLVYLLRYFGSYLSEDKDSNNANLRVCSQIMSYIDSRIYTMKSLSDVAQEMGYNYSYISTLFRKTCGITLNSYFKTKRMNEAKKLLQNKEMSVSEIARMMNYSSVYAFSKAFKEHFGASPGHFTGRYPSK